jgi:hypothetical protein
VFTLEPLDEVPSLENREITTEWSHIAIKEEEIKTKASKESKTRQIIWN